MEKLKISNKTNIEEKGINRPIFFNSKDETFIFITTREGMDYSDFWDRPNHSNVVKFEELGLELSSYKGDKIIPQEIWDQLFNMGWMPIIDLNKKGDKIEFCVIDKVNDSTKVINI